MNQILGTLTNEVSQFVAAGLVIKFNALVAIFLIHFFMASDLFWKPWFDF